LRKGQAGGIPPLTPPSARLFLQKVSSNFFVKAAPARQTGCHV